MAAIELKEIITTTMSFNARCHKGEIQSTSGGVQLTCAEMRGNILKKIYDVPCMKYETRDGKVQKVKVTSANTKISEMITIDGIDIYLRYRLKPFKSHKSAVQSNMNNAIVPRKTSTRDLEGSRTRYSPRVSSQAPDGLPRLTCVDYEQDVGTAFEGGTRRGLGESHTTQHQESDHGQHRLLQLTDNDRRETLEQYKDGNEQDRPQDKHRGERKQAERVSQRRSRFIRAKLRTTLPGTL
jgi:hypothetical protein